MRNGFQARRLPAGLLAKASAEDAAALAAKPHRGAFHSTGVHPRLWSARAFERLSERLMESPDQSITLIARYCR